MHVDVVVVVFFRVFGLSGNVSELAIHVHKIRSIFPNNDNGNMSVTRFYVLKSIQIIFSVDYLYPKKCQWKREFNPFIFGASWIYFITIIALSKTMLTPFRWQLPLKRKFILGCLLKEMKEIMFEMNEYSDFFFFLEVWWVKHLRI